MLARTLRSSGWAHAFPIGAHRCFLSSVVAQRTLHCVAASQRLIQLKSSRCHSPRAPSLFFSTTVANGTGPSSFGVSTFSTRVETSSEPLNLHTSQIECRLADFSDDFHSGNMGPAELPFIEGIVAEFRQQIMHTLLASAPPPHILNQITTKIEGEVDISAPLSPETDRRESRTIRSHHILLDTKEMAQDVLNMLDAGNETFASLARRHSK